MKNLKFDNREHYHISVMGVFQDIFQNRVQFMPYPGKQIASI